MAELRPTARNRKTVFTRVQKKRSMDRPESFRINEYSHVFKKNINRKHKYLV